MTLFALDGFVGLGINDVDGKLHWMKGDVDQGAIDLGLMAAGGVTFKGGYDAATNTPDLDSTPIVILKGDMYVVTVNGTFFTEAVQVGDALISNIDTPTVLTDWTILDGNNQSVFLDGLFRVQNTADPTKQLAWDVSAITTATTRTITMPDSNLDLTPGTGSFATEAEGNLAATAMQDLIDDTTPQLGGNLDANSKTIDGRVVATDGTKLDGIEANATIDQTGAEIKTAYEAEANAYTDTKDTKLSGIETLADVTDETNVKSSLDGATIPTATVSGTDKVLLQDVDDSDNLKTVTAQAIADLGAGGSTFADDVFRVQDNADATKQIALEASAITTGTTRTITMPDQNIDLTPGTGSFATEAEGNLAATALQDLIDDTTPQLGGNLDANGKTIDGRVVATDGTKLDTIETNAKDDQTGAEIKTAYEAEANAYTDTKNTKLAGIETSADVTDAANVAAAGAVMDSDISEAEGFLRKTGAGAYEAIKSNLGAITDPGTGNDNTEGYAVGSLWINVTLDKVFQAVDVSTGAAVWKDLSGAASVTSVNTETGVVVLDEDDINSGNGTIASATTTDIGAEQENRLEVSGTTTITSFGTVAAGVKRTLIFLGNLVLTHNATKILLPTQANIVVSTSDVIQLISLGGDLWRVTSYERVNGTALAEREFVSVAVSDETTDLTTGTAKVTFRMPFALTLNAGNAGVRANVNTAPVGSTIIVDINAGGSTILSTKLSIDASEKTSLSAASAAVISDLTLDDDQEITIDIDQIGSSTAGKGLKISLRGTRTIL